MSNSKEGVMAAILAVIDQIEAGESLTAAAEPSPSYGISFWKYSGLQEIMSMRMLGQLWVRVL